VSPRRCIALLGMLGSAGLGACATKSDVQQIQTDVALFKAESGRRDSARAAQLDEIIRMQRGIYDSLGTVGRAVGRLKGDLAADLYNIQQQLVQLQELTGQSQQSLNRLKTQLEARLEQLQATAHTDTAAAPVQSPSGGAPASEIYNASLAQLQVGNNATARQGLQDLVRSYPSSELVPDALYNIGQSFAGENQDSAAAYYQQVTDRYPTSLRAPEALYKLAAFAASRKDNDKAKRLYQQIVDKYPQSNAAGLARDKLKAPPR
jgi:tol-pal system protein YbgF